MKIPDSFKSMTVEELRKQLFDSSINPNSRNIYYVTDGGVGITNLQLVKELRTEGGQYYITVGADSKEVKVEKEQVLYYVERYS